MRQISIHNTNQVFLCFTACLILITYLSCSTSQQALFRKRTPHEQYEDRITDAGLKQTTLGSLWFSAAFKGINQPLTISLPYKETGYFAAERPNAAGFQFAARRGEKLVIAISKKPLIGFRLFADLWQINNDGSREFLDFADTITNTLNYEVKKDGDYLLRMQPELLSSGEYTLILTTEPSLAFPVPSSANPHIGSFWGDNRDNGARRHEGIDIFGKFRTPVVAAADGYISSVREGGIGGKVIFLKPKEKDYTIYYAHLDSQIAREGERVKAGDIVGLMGNTGNAKNTATHLHLGIYTFSGAVDPFPFVNRNRALPENINASLKLLNKYVRTTTHATVYAAPHTKADKIFSMLLNNIALTEAATASWYKILLPDGKEGFISSNVVTPTNRSIKKYTTQHTIYLLDRPDSTAAHKAVLSSNENINILGSFNAFNYIQKDNLTGWIDK